MPENENDSVTDIDREAERDVTADDFLAMSELGVDEANPDHQDGPDACEACQ
jgi:hypothetical protein